MKLWISGELDADVADKHQVARKVVEAAINRRLKTHEFVSRWKSWDFISIIMSDRDFYEEVAKKSKKDQSLEFRLKLDHAAFVKATQRTANRLLVDALRRSVEKMTTMEVADRDVAFLQSTLAAVRKEV